MGTLSARVVLQGILGCLGEGYTYISMWKCHVSRDTHSERMQKAIVKLQQSRNEQQSQVFSSNPQHEVPPHLL